MASTKKKAAKKVSSKAAVTQKEASKAGPKKKAVAKTSPPKQPASKKAAVPKAKSVQTTASKAKSQPTKSAAPKTKSKVSKSATASMSFKDVMAALKANGSAQTVKTFRNHGVTGEMFGVSYAFLKTLHKQIKTDHALAEALWQSGIHDARVFACWVADANQTTAKMLHAWAKDVDNHVLAYELASLAQDCDLAPKVMDTWIAKKDEWTTTLGWTVATRLAMQATRPETEGGLNDKRIAELLDQITRMIHTQPNRTRHAMNGTVIGIGCRSQAWRKRAHAAAKKIGKVDVDYGVTSCKVSDASASIEKSWTHYEPKGQQPSDGTAGKRRRHC